MHHKFTWMSNSLVGDQQVAVLDVDEKPEDEKRPDFDTVLLCLKNHEDPMTLNYKISLPLS